MGKVDVAFVIESEGSVLAVMPGLAGRVGNPESMICYAHLGQHSSADISYIMEECNEALLDEYAGLLAELGRVGYDVNVIPIDIIDGDEYRDERRKQLDGNDYGA